jgi:hypothetical protein
VTDQLTRHPNRDHNAIWSPDDSRVAFDGHRDGTQFLYAMRADGTGKEQALYASKPGEQIDVMAWGREFIVFARAKSLTEEASPELVALPLVGEQQPFVYLPRVARGRAALSPDGRWLAYVADAGGMKQVVVQSFPDPALNRYQISASGGVNPVWSRDGRELFYIDGDRRMVAVSVSTQGAFAVKSSADLFAAPTLVYDVAPDGRFLFSVPSASAGAGRIHVILNWTTIMENSSRQGK